jgi:hypothetical protein
VLVSEAAELPLHDLLGDALTGEGACELLHGGVERGGVLSEDLHERLPGCGRDRDPVSLSPAGRPRPKLLARDLDLSDPADGLDDLREVRRHLAALRDRGREDEGGVLHRCLQVSGELRDRILGERAGVRHEERAAVAEQRRRREVGRLAALPLGAVDLPRLEIADDLQRDVTEQEGVLAPEQHDVRIRLRHRYPPESTSSPLGANVTVMSPC